ncbi:MAG: proline--tRNA ligase [Phycisphaerae bacterium]
MRYSQLLIPTVKEVPAEAEIPSHQLMIRAGFIRKLASGTYTYLPLGWRSLRKIMNIVREEMDFAGAQEVSMPILQPMELWEQTGRNVVFQDIMCKFTDRHGRQNVLAPTAEEVVTSLAAGDIKSYKQLPVNLYQINTKFRDEFRPRFGVLRSREFIMKDAYSFDATVDGVNDSYQKMYRAYCRIFSRCGLNYVTVEADSGGMGGTDTEEFMVPCSAGEDIIVHTEDYSYAANIEKAEVDPAAAVAAGADAPNPEEVHTPGVGTIEAVCEFLGTEPSEMIKTLIYWKTAPDVQQKLIDLQSQIVHQQAELAREERTLEGAVEDDQENRVSGEFAEKMDDARAAVEMRRSRLASLKEQLCTEYGKLDVLVALLRGDHEANEMKIAAAVGHAVELADERTIEELTGAKVGFAGPVGLVEKVCRLVVDPAVAAMPTGISGANRTDYHVRNVVPGRDFPLEGERVQVADIRNAAEGDTHDGKALLFARGIEVGHVFKLGTKYSKHLGATFLDEDGKEQPCIMGCYGIGINRILASAIETGHDKDGCILPVSIAPFEVMVVRLNADKENVTVESERIYAELKSRGADVLLDDRDARPGVKFKDADLLGIPLRIVVGDRGLKEGKVEIKRRTDEKPTLVEAASAVEEAMDILRQMRDALKTE